MGAGLTFAAARLGQLLRTKPEQPRHFPPAIPAHAPIIVREVPFLDRGGGLGKPRPHFPEMLEPLRAFRPTLGLAEKVENLLRVLAGLVLARLALAGGDRARAAAILATMVTEGESPADVHRTLAKLLLEQGDTTRAADALERLMYVDPYTVEDHAQLAALYDRLGDRRRVVRERRAVVALNPVDRADALYLLALAYRAAGDTVNARHSVIQSLEQAPHFERAQELLLALHEAAQTAPASQGKKP